MNRKASWLPWLLAILLSAAPAAAADRSLGEKGLLGGGDGIVGVQVEDDALQARIRLLGITVADLTVAFEEVVGLSAQNLGLSADLLDALELQGLLSRLPSSLVSVPSSLPLLVTIEPPSSGGLSFSGTVSIELYTHLLTYLPGCPFRLYAAPLGGPFQDITEAHSGGSYRVRGRKGEFSEFLIVADLRGLDAVIDEKFTRLEQKLASHAAAIEPSVHAGLVTLLDGAAAAYGSGDTVGAIALVEDFAEMVEDGSGAAIPDVWRSARDLENAAGDLRAAAATLRFSLLLKANA